MSTIKIIASVSTVGLRKSSNKGFEEDSHVSLLRGQSFVESSTFKMAILNMSFNFESPKTL